jgi:hypothetical protein
MSQTCELPVSFPVTSSESTVHPLCSTYATGSALGLLTPVSPQTHEDVFFYDMTMASMSSGDGNFSALVRHIGGCRWQQVLELRAGLRVNVFTFCTLDSPGWGLSIGTVDTGPVFLCGGTGLSMAGCLAATWPCPSGCQKAFPNHDSSVRLHWGWARVPEIRWAGWEREKGLDPWLAQGAGSMGNPLRREGQDER